MIYIKDNMKTKFKLYTVEIKKFRDITVDVISDEIKGFWSDWTPNQQFEYLFGDWLSFSESRGYSTESISTFGDWIKCANRLFWKGINPMEEISDIVGNAAKENIKKDKKGEILLSSHPPAMSKGDIINGILKLEEKIKYLPESMEGDCFGLKHSFGEGCYVREIMIPKDTLSITKIHAFSHPAFVLSGKCFIKDGNEENMVEGPCYFITKAGTKRVIRAYSDVILVTVHVTDKTDIDLIEKDIIFTGGE